MIRNQWKLEIEGCELDNNLVREGEEEEEGMFRALEVSDKPLLDFQRGAG